MMTQIKLATLAVIAGLLVSPPAAGYDDVNISATTPRFIRGPKVVYPPGMLQQGAHGTVMVRVLIGTEGKALQVGLERSSGWRDLDNAALDAVRGAQWEISDEPTWARVPINFVLR